MLHLHEVGGKCLKYLRRGWNRTKGRGHKDLKRGGGGKLGQGGGVPTKGRGHKDLKKGGTSWVKGGSALKRGGLESAYELCITSILDIPAHL